MPLTTNKVPKLASLASTIVMACEAYRNCSANPDHPWGARWASLLDSIEAELLPSGGGFDNGTKIDREATNAKRISLRIDFHHMDKNGFYDGWTSHNVTISPTFRGCEVRVSGSNRNEIRDYISEVVSSLFSESNRIAYTFDDQGEVTLIPEQAQFKGVFSMATKHKIQVSCERTFQGAWKLSALVGGQLHTKQYLYYNKAEALLLFRSFLKSLV